MRLERDYFYSKKAGRPCPTDESLRPIEAYYPGLTKMMVRMAAQESFDEGSKTCCILLAEHRPGEVKGFTRRYHLKQLVWFECFCEVRGAIA